MKMPPPVLPDWIPRRELSRPSAEQIARGENKKQTLTYAGANAVIPVVYGEQIVGGPVIAGPARSTDGNSVVLAIALSWAGEGGIEGIEDVRLGDDIKAYGSSNGSQASFTGITTWIYDGSQTVPDSTLSSEIPGFDDTFEGVAYVAIRVTSAAALPNAIKLQWRVKGRKVRTDETPTVSWTENPVLHMRDFVENDEFGMGASLIGWQAAADVADSLYSGLPRTRAGLTLQDPMTEDDVLALFAQYAEVLWSYDGRNVSIIPDVKADTIHILPADTIREGSLRLSTAGLEEMPTQVRIEFVDRNDPQWATRPAIAEVPEHTLHGAPTSPSSVPLPGVFNRLEAERRAYQRLQRLQTPGRLEWQMFAPGMPYQAGDVVRMPNIRGMRSIDVRLMAQPEMVGPLIYQMAGEIYRASDYPEGAVGTSIPTGAIVILRGEGAVPDGFVEKDFGGRLIREGAPGGAGTLFNLTCDVYDQPGGAHTGTIGTLSNTENLLAPPGGPVGGRYYYSGGTDQPRGEHSHGGVTFTLSSLSAVRRQRLRFIKRTGSATLAPERVAVLAGADVSDARWLDSTPTGGGYLTAGSTEESLANTTSLSRQLGVAGSHDHHSSSDPYSQRATSDPGEGYGLVLREMATASGGHVHNAYANVAATLRSVALAVHESLGDATIQEGGIVGWEDDTGSIPPGWALCDGQNGTIDLTDRFIYLTAKANGGEHAASSTWSITAAASTSQDGAHDHDDYFNIWSVHWDAPPLNGIQYRHPSGGSHWHYTTGSNSGSLDGILRYQLRFIQYIGS